LFNDAADYNYTNDTIQTPLYDAYSSIFDIIAGHTAHPIMPLFRAHMENEQIMFLKANPGKNPTSSNLLHAASCFPFSVPVLPGDASLAIDFIASLKIHIGKQPIDECALESVGQALFNLVILWTYLGCPPENDLDIFQVVRNGHISRIWTSHEQALAACYREDDTSPGAMFDTIPNPNLWGVRVVRDIDLELTMDDPFVAINQPITWTSSPGLTGGPCKPRRYRPPSMQLLNQGPRLKPRPAYRNKQTPAETSIATSMVTKRALGTMSDVETPAPKRRSTRNQLTDYLAPLDEMEDSGLSSQMPPKVRRETRQQKVVRFADVDNSHVSNI
jgi:hypothetical protein